MSEEQQTSSLSDDFVEMVAQIVSAYVSKNSVPAGDVAGLIASVHQSIAALGAAPIAAAEPAPTPAVSVKKSVHRDYLISLEDGKHYRSLRRHLTSRGLTPDEYRAKWNLPSDHPMVCAAYSEHRSTLAKSLGLGIKRGADAQPEIAEEPAPRRRGRQKKAA